MASILTETGRHSQIRSDLPWLLASGLETSPNTIWYDHRIARTNGKFLAVLCTREGNNATENNAILLQLEVDLPDGLATADVTLILQGVVR